MPAGLVADFLAALPTPISLGEVRRPNVAFPARPRLKGIPICMAIGAASLLPMSRCRSQTTVWLSATSGNWTTAADWSAGAPGDSNGASITVTGGSYTVTVNSNALTMSLNLNSASATLLISGTSLSLTGSGGASSVQAGTLQLSGGSIAAGTTGYSFTNEGTISNIGGTGYIYGEGNPDFAFTNSGTVSSTGGTLTWAAQGRTASPTSAR